MDNTQNQKGLDLSTLTTPEAFNEAEKQIQRLKIEQATKEIKEILETRVDITKREDLQKVIKEKVAELRAGGNVESEKQVAYNELCMDEKIELSADVFEELRKWVGNDEAAAAIGAYSNGDGRVYDELVKANKQLGQAIMEFARSVADHPAENQGEVSQGEPAQDSTTETRPAKTELLRMRR